MKGFPQADVSGVTLDLAGHVYHFRRLTWEDEVAFTTRFPQGSRQVYVAFAMTSIDGKTVTFEQALALLKALPRPVADRVIIYYYGSLPSRRLPKSNVPYSAPEPRAYVQEVSDEAEAEQDAGYAELERQFGKEEVQETMDLSRRMVEATAQPPALPAPEIPEDPAAPGEVKVVVW